MNSTKHSAELRLNDVDHSNCEHHGRYHSCKFCQQLRDKDPEQFRKLWNSPSAWPDYVRKHLQWFIDFHGHEPPSLDPIQEKLNLEVS